jgi:hypothetical protein
LDTKLVIVTEICKLYALLLDMAHEREPYPVILSTAKDLSCPPTITGYPVAEQQLKDSE